MSEKAKTNDLPILPDVKEVTIGTREPRKVTIYPLSMYDQLQIIDRISDVIESIQDVTEDNVKDNIGLLKTVIFDNLEVILEYITDEADRPSLKELTNNQFYEIAETVFVVNFEGFLKNFKALLERASKTLPKINETKK